MLDLLFSSVLAALAAIGITAVATLLLASKALEGTPPKMRADILRALADVVRALHGSKLPK